MNDFEEVRRLLALYCELVDGADWEGVGALFADGVLADEAGAVIARGREGVAKFYREGTLLYDGSPRTKHLTMNTVLDRTSARTIAGRSSFVVIQSSDDGALQPIIAGRYLDTFVKHDGASWSFSERRFVVDLAGDLSGHRRGPDGPR